MIAAPTREYLMLNVKLPDYWIGSAGLEMGLNWLKMAIKIVENEQDGLYISESSTF